MLQNGGRRPRELLVLDGNSDVDPDDFDAKIPEIDRKREP